MGIRVFPFPPQQLRSEITVLNFGNSKRPEALQKEKGKKKPETHGTPARPKGVESPPNDRTLVRHVLIAVDVQKNVLS